MSSTSVVQRVVCVADTGAPSGSVICPTGYSVQYVPEQAQQLNPTEVNTTELLAFFSFSFSIVISAYLVSKYAGVILNLIRRG